MGEWGNRNREIDRGNKIGKFKFIKYGNKQENKWGNKSGNK